MVVQILSGTHREQLLFSIIENIFFYWTAPLYKVEQKIIFNKTLQPKVNFNMFT